MVATNLPAACWIIVALIAAFMVWMCLSVLGAALEYECKRRNLGREVRDLQRRYSLSFRDVIINPDVIKDGNTDRNAA